MTHVAPNNGHTRKTQSRNATIVTKSDILHVIAEAESAQDIRDHAVQHIIAEDILAHQQGAGTLHSEDAIVGLTLAIESIEGDLLLGINEKVETDARIEVEAETIQQLQSVNGAIKQVSLSNNANKKLG